MLSSAAQAFAEEQRVIAGVITPQCGRTPADLGAVRRTERARSTAVSHWVAGSSAKPSTVQKPSISWFRTRWPTLRRCGCPERRTGVDVPRRHVRQLRRCRDWQGSHRRHGGGVRAGPIGSSTPFRAALQVQLQSGVQSKGLKGPALQTLRGQSRRGEHQRLVWQSRNAASRLPLLAVLGRQRRMYCFSPDRRRPSAAHGHAFGPGTQRPHPPWHRRGAPPTRRRVGPEGRPREGNHRGHRPVVPRPA